MFRNPYADGLIVLLIVLLIFGPKRLPTLGRSLGQGLREFKDSITGDSRADGEEPPEISEVAETADPRPATMRGGSPSQGAAATGQPAPASFPPERETTDANSEHRG